MYIALYFAEQRDILFLYITLYSIRHTPTPTPYAKNTPKLNIGVYDKYMCCMLRDKYVCCVYFEQG